MTTIMLCVIIHKQQSYGRLAQLVEHLLDVQRVSGSNPLASTKAKNPLKFSTDFLSEDLSEEIRNKKE